MRHSKIAVILSSHMRHCEGFLRANNLPRDCFYLITRPEQLMGMDRNIPIIITYHEWNNDWMRLGEMLDARNFKSIRYFDY